MLQNCDRGLENAFLNPRSQFFTIRTDPTLFLQLLTYSTHTSCLGNAVDCDKLNVLKNNIFISTMPFSAV